MQNSVNCLLLQLCVIVFFYYFYDDKPPVRKGFLRVIVSEDFQVSKQCIKGINTVNRILGMIKGSFGFKSPQIILQLCKSLKYCIMEVWRPYLQKDITLLERVQHHITRIILVGLIL